MKEGCNSLILKELMVQSFMASLGSKDQVRLRGGETLEEDSCIAIVSNVGCLLNGCHFSRTCVDV